jgi:fumarate reductase flavoprotein subunit
MKKKILSCLLAGVMSVTLFGCSTATGSTAGAVKDGTYTATGTGFQNGEVKVTITVKDGKITDAEVDSSSQSKGYGQDAAEGLAEEIVEEQSGDIDVVSGATATRNAVKEAVEDCMEQAGFNTETAKGEDETLETDVVVVGMGASGTTAALRAAEGGASVIGVEATETLGGFGNAAKGMFAVGSVEQKDRYGEDGETTDEEYWYEHFQERNNNAGNAKLIRTFISEAKNTVSYMLNHGVGFFLSKTAQQIAHFDTEIVYHRWNNANPFEYLGDALEDAGVEVHYNTTANTIIVDKDGNATGVKCEKEDGGTLTINAKSVIISTGSFANNEELMKETLGEDVYENCNVMAGSYAPGIDMMWEIGADEGELLTMNHGVTTKNVEDEETVSELTLNSPILWVNNQGKRFMNEDLLKDTVEFTTAVLAQGGTAYTIVDQTTVDRWTDMTQENTGTWIHYWDQHGIVGEDGEPTIYHAPISTDDWNSGFEALTKAGEGGVFDTIEEAAEFIGCSAEDLQETIDNYNSYVKSGNDTEFFKSKDSLKYSVSEGPYYVTKGHAGVLGALGGVNTTEKLEVLNTNHEVIKNLYATGNNVSGISCGTYQDVEGVGLGFSLTSGRLAGIEAARNAGYEVEDDTTELTETGEETMEEATERGMQGTQ